MLITFELTRSDIYTEVEKTSAYVGDKMIGQEDAYQRIRATDENRELLQRYFNEALSEVTQIIKGFYESTRNIGDIVCIDLSVPNNFDQRLEKDIENTMFSFFVNFILSRWFIITNKEEATIYIQETDNLKKELQQKLYARRRPTSSHVNPDTPGQTPSTSIIVQKI